MTTTVATPKELLSLGGKRLGTTKWIEITQDQVNMFADSTGDHQWNHVDPVRAEASPFGGTIVHGYLTLALAPVFMDEVLQIQGYDAVLNYGVNRVRFTAPLLVGASVRGAITLLTAREREPGNLEATFEIRYEVQGSDRPACVAETVYLYR
jgi:acyl dehydratase